MPSPDEIARYEALMLASRCPCRHRSFLAVTATAPSHPWSKAWDKVRPQFGTGFLMVLHGHRGPGKTQLAVELIRHASMLFKTSLYMRVYDILLDVKSTFGKDASDTERDVVEKLCAPQLLVIDECTERKEGDWDGRLLTYLCDRRYAAMKDTMLIGNASLDEMANSLGASITDRVNQTGKFLHCDWPSFR